MLTLYGTAACHLCELAAELLDASGAPYREVDISESDVLFERYGLTIPVLQREDGGELNWPFDAALLGEFLAAG
ncbi:glutaredoxin family protein [Haliea sp. E17]|uniref:glutaredoxin family protein n=1 Tax=Haliea sp. E17 TaxID=3401576 RepID=UPI003AAACBAA